MTILQVLILDMGCATEKWQRCLEVVALVDSQQRRGLTPKLRYLAQLPLALVGLHAQNHPSAQSPLGAAGAGLLVVAVWALMCQVLRSDGRVDSWHPQ